MPCLLAIKAMKQRNKLYLINSGAVFFMPEFHGRFSSQKAKFVGELMEKNTILKKWIVSSKIYEYKYRSFLDGRLNY